MATQWLKTKAILPGFRITAILSFGWVGSLVVLPLVLLIASVFQLSWGTFFDTISSPRVLSALSLTLVVALFATLINMIFGTIVAWLLVRYEFPGKKIINGLIDFPFALPTAVAGIVLATLYAPNGLFGQYFAPFNIQIAFTPIGIVIALIFVSFPFTVRAVQSVLSNLDRSLEEASALLGATPLQTFHRVIFPAIRPALFSGAGMGFARCLGEYGSVIFIAGNIPQVSEIVPLIIMSKLDMYDVAGASAIALLMLLLSFSFLLLLNFFQGRWQEIATR